MNQVHNLDEGVLESFNFIVKGHEYKFRHLNTDEMEEARKIGEDEEKAKNYLYQFISPVKPESPKFEEVAKQMITSQWKNFRAMLKSEIGE